MTDKAPTQLKYLEGTARDTKQEISSLYEALRTAGNAEQSQICAPYIYQAPYTWYSTLL